MVYCRHIWVHKTNILCLADKYKHDKSLLNTTLTEPAFYLDRRVMDLMDLESMQLEKIPLPELFTTHLTGLAVTVLLSEMSAMRSDELVRVSILTGIENYV